MMSNMQFTGYDVSYAVKRELANSSPPPQGSGLPPYVSIPLGHARTAAQAKAIAEAAVRDLPALEARLDQRAQEELAEQERQRERYRQERERREAEREGGAS
jgi:hypothetical protein